MKKGVYRLRIFLDSKYSSLNDFTVEILKKLFPNNKVGILKAKCNMITITLYHKYLAILFPQHGAGKKHNRDIKLFDWQTNILRWEYFFAGFFGSDGCFYFSRKNNMEAYNFTNKSKQIIDLFVKCCEYLGIKFTFNQKSGNGIYYINIYRKKYVSFLKELIGTKSDFKLPL